ncbi:MAG: CdaR family protein [Candidatus Acidiferrales bacterium]
MRWLRTYIFPNWWLKLAALAISCVLWTTYTDEPISEVGFALPLEFVNIPPTLEISSDVPTTIHVRVRGRSALVRRLTTSDLSVSVDLSNAKPGDLGVHLDPQMVEVPFGATVARISPSDFQIVISPRRAPPPAHGD